MLTSDAARTLFGPFDQLLTMANLPEKGSIGDDALLIVPNAGIIIQAGRIAEIGPFESLRHTAPEIREIEGPLVVLPGFVDSHTHICFAGSRVLDYTRRLSGQSYLQIAAAGGGILETMRRTSQASEEQLIALLLRRLDQHLALGVTTCEVKSGYGIKLVDELEILNAVAAAARLHPVTVVPTCLAAHTLPPDFSDATQFINFAIKETLPRVKQARFASRCDIYIDDASGFSVPEARRYLLAARDLGYKLTVHADQFHRGGAALAAEVGAVSADHLEASLPEDFDLLRKANVAAVVLPGASLGLGMPFAQARTMLDHNLSLVIASGWNPGSAPMGDLLTQAALLGMNQRLTHAETFAAMTARAARVLQLRDRGILAPGMRADLVLFPCADYREILYHQGALRPIGVFAHGQHILLAPHS